MLNTTVLQATYKSQTNLNIDAKQDINPVDEQTKQDLIFTAVLVEDRLYDTDIDFTKILLRCANCGFLSKGQSFGDAGEGSSYHRYRFYLNKCPRCNSKAIFRDKTEQEIEREKQYAKNNRS